MGLCTWTMIDISITTLYYICMSVRVKTQNPVQLNPKKKRNFKSTYIFFIVQYLIVMMMILKTLMQLCNLDSTALGRNVFPI